MDQSDCVNLDSFAKKEKDQTETKDFFHKKVGTPLSGGVQFLFPPQDEFLRFANCLPEKSSSFYHILG